jgi:polyphenol oxidase
MQPEYDKLVCRVKGLEQSGIISGFTYKAIQGLKIKEELNPVFSEQGIDYKEFIYLDQVHSNKVVRFSGSFKGKSPVFKADGLVTDQKGFVLCVRTADCLPVIFVHRQKNISGVIHIGWKPAKAGIIDNFLEVLKEYNIESLESSYFVLGPGLRNRCFRIGREFLEYRQFRSYIYRYKDEYILDIVNFVKDKFISAGADKAKIYDSGICSLCDNNFYSYRRGDIQKRTVSFILS